MKIILHIGDSKTGTTALQVALRQAAENNKICYPGVRLNHNALAQCFTRAGKQQLLQKRLSELAQNIQVQHKTPNVISAEHLQYADPCAVKESMSQQWPEAELWVFAYVRPHVEKLSAMYSERLKFGAYHLSYSAYARHVMASQKLDYAPRFARWAETFGGNFKLCPYASAFDILPDFAGRVFGDAAFLGAGRRENKSLTVTQAALIKTVPDVLKHIGGSVPLPKTITRLIHLRLRQSGLGANAPRIGPATALLAQIQQRYEQDSERVDHMIDGPAGLTNSLKEAAPCGDDVRATELEREQFKALLAQVLQGWRKAPKVFEATALAELKAQFYSGDPIAGAKI